jgi:hypothetical protein
MVMPELAAVVETRLVRQSELYMWDGHLLDLLTV